MPYGFSCIASPPRHRDHREFARRVGAETHAAILAGHRRGVDDVAAFTMGAHVRPEAADAMVHAHQVDVDHPAPIVERDVVDAAAGRTACIVADYVDLAERPV